MSNYIYHILFKLNSGEEIKDWTDKDTTLFDIEQF